MIADNGRDYKDLPHLTEDDQEFRDKFLSWDLGNLSFADVQEYLKVKDTILVPIASFEQHGPHLPIYTDTITCVEVSKRVAEMLVQSQNGCGLSQTRFMIVRFGNVVGSVGSVVPLFRKQIEKGGPVTVTHPEATRYFMTIPESCQLILQTGAMGQGGEIFILKMGTPIRIDDMARDLIRLSGFEPDVDIDIEYIGLRPGEKLNEELIIEGEGILPTTHEKIMVLKGLECNLQVLDGNINELAKSADEQNRKKIITKLREIVPEYIPVTNSTTIKRDAIG